LSIEESQLIIGWYDEESGRRLPAETGDRVVLMEKGQIQAR